MRVRFRPGVVDYANAAFSRAAEMVASRFDQGGNVARYFFMKVSVWLAYNRSIAASLKEQSLINLPEQC